MRRAAALLAAAAWLAAFALAGAARADEPPAERLFREGRALMLDGRFAEACPKIAESQRLDPHVGTLLNLAACHERLGKIGSAWVEFQQALTAAHAEGQSDRERLAHDRIEALEPRVPWLTLALPPGAAPDGVAISLDGADLASGALGKELPVDPGPHVVVASRSGAEPVRQEIAIAEAEHRTVVVALGAPAAAAASSRATTPSLVVAPSDGGVAPRAAAAPSGASPAASRERWVVEAGLFVGYLSASVDAAEPASPGAVPLRSYQAGAADTSCAAVGGCSLDLSRVGGAVAGVDLFAGYAPTERIAIGGRLVAGPRLSRGGGSFVATGPSAELDALGRLWFGASLVLGGAAVGGTGEVQPPSGYFVAGGGPYEGSASISRGGVAYGAGFLADLRIVDAPPSSLAVRAAPMFLLGSSGSAWTFPFTLVYRFH